MTGLGAALIVGVIAGMVVSWILWKPKKTVETYAAAEVQADGSQKIERKPDPSAKPPHMVPKGAKVERVIQVRVQPRPADPLPSIHGSDETALPQPPSPVPCPPVTVDLSLVRLPDGMRRVIASSPDGTILPGAVDIPVEAAAPEPRKMVWAAGAYWKATQWGTSQGITAERDLAFLRIGADLGRARVNLPTGGTLQGAEIGVRVMIRF